MAVPVSIWTQGPVRVLLIREEPLALSVLTRYENLGCAKKFGVGRLRSVIDFFWVFIPNRGAVSSCFHFPFSLEARIVQQHQTESSPSLPNINTERKSDPISMQESEYNTKWTRPLDAIELEQPNLFQTP